MSEVVGGDNKSDSWRGSYMNGPCRKTFELFGFSVSLNDNSNLFDCLDSLGDI